MKTKYGELEKVLRQTAQARQDQKKAIAKLNAQSKDYTPEHIKEYIDPQIREAQGGMKALHQAGYEKVAGLLHELSNLAAAKHCKLNLANPAWANALKLIELLGAGIDSETVEKINESFKNDQSALRALRGVYKAKGVIYDGGLTDQIYEPESAFEHLTEYAFTVFVRGGSLNELSGAISKIAALEGINFPKMVDEAGSIDAIRHAAGLPDAEVK